MARISAAERRRIQQTVEHYKTPDVSDAVRSFLRAMEGYITQSSRLAPFIHTIRARMKEPRHLRDKLERKCKQAKEDGLSFSITPDNLLRRVTDLAGLRIL